MYARSLFFSFCSRFLSVLLGILARRPYTRAKSCDELLIDDSFIKTRRVVHVLWHFLTLDLQRTDTNAPLSFKLVYKLVRVCGPLRKGVGEGEWEKKKALTSRYTDRLGLKAWTDAREEKVRLRVWLCVWGNFTPDFKKCMKNTRLFFSPFFAPWLDTEKESKRFPECQGKTQFK